jgi:aryl-alcohol dehydrogenase-like predicted oxidoreductase
VRPFLAYGPSQEISYVLDPISQDESSEAFIGEWAEKRGIRDQLVIATKVILGFFLYVVGR